MFFTVWGIAIQRQTIACKSSGQKGNWILCHIFSGGFICICPHIHTCYMAQCAYIPAYFRGTAVGHFNSILSRYFIKSKTNKRTQTQRFPMALHWSVFPCDLYIYFKCFVIFGGFQSFWNICIHVLSLFFFFFLNHLLIWMSALNLVLPFLWRLTEIREEPGPVICEKAISLNVIDSIIFIFWIIFFSSLVFLWI